MTSNALIAIFISGIAGLSTMLGALVINLKLPSKYIDKFITFCIAFSLIIMIGISITDLIPHSFFYIILKYPHFKGLLITFLTFLSGVGVVILINHLIKFNNNDLYKLGILNMIALIIHNFPEGIATFMSSFNDIEVGLKLSIAIMLHNIPEGIAIAVPIYYATNSKRKAFIRTFLSGLSEPLGAIIAFLLLQKYINDTIISGVLLVVAGIMITLSIHDMLPKALKYNQKKYLYLGFIVGVIFISVAVFFF